MTLMRYVNKLDVTIKDSQLFNVIDDKMYYCKYCKKNVPIRSKHVKRTDKHYLTFDHDCLFLRTVICEKNYLLFIILEGLEIIYHYLTYKMCYYVTGANNFIELNRNYPNTSKCYLISIFFLLIMTFHYMT